MSKKNSLKNITLAAMFLALAMVLPFLTGQIPTIGSALSPMHIPVLLAGFVVGPVYAGLIGFIAPFLRFVLFGMPPIVKCFSMSFELLAYGLTTGLLYRALPKNTMNVYVSLIGAMLVGRIIWGLASYLLTSGSGSFTFNAFLAGGFINAIPGIILHIILIPLIVLYLRKHKFID